MKILVHYWTFVFFGQLLEDSPTLISAHIHDIGQFKHFIIFGNVEFKHGVRFEAFNFYLFHILIV